MSGGSGTVAPLGTAFGGAANQKAVLASAEVHEALSGPFRILFKQRFFRSKTLFAKL